VAGEDEDEGEESDAWSQSEEGEGAASVIHKEALMPTVGDFLSAVLRRQRAEHE